MDPHFVARLGCQSASWTALRLAPVDRINAFCRPLSILSSSDICKLSSRNHLRSALKNTREQNARIPTRQTSTPASRHREMRRTKCPRRGEARRATRSEHPASRFSHPHRGSLDLSAAQGTRLLPPAVTFGEFTEYHGNLRRRQPFSNAKRCPGRRRDRGHGKGSAGASPSHRPLLFDLEDRIDLDRPTGRQRRCRMRCGRRRPRPGRTRRASPRCTR